jgi:hypothetical protein
LQPCCRDTYCAGRGDRQGPVPPVHLAFRNMRVDLCDLVERACDVHANTLPRKDSHVKSSGGKRAE